MVSLTRERLGRLFNCEHLVFPQEMAFLTRLYGITRIDFKLWFKSHIVVEAIYYKNKSFDRKPHRTCKTKCKYKCCDVVIY